MTTSPFDRLVIGAGLSGLAHAWTLSLRGLDVGVVEREGLVANDERHQQVDGFRIAPAGATLAVLPPSTSFESWVGTIPNAPILARVPVHARQQFLLRPSGLYPTASVLGQKAAWPTRSDSLLSSLRSATRKPRAVNPSSSASETLHQFVLRTFGASVTHTWLRSHCEFVHGVSPDRLGAASVFPHRVAQAHKRGALTKIESAEQAAHYKGALVPEGGLSPLLERVVAALPRRVHLDHDVESMSFDESARLWTVMCANGVTLSARAITLATNAHEQARLLMPHIPAIADRLQAIPYTARTACALALRPDDAAGIPPGQGYWTSGQPRSRVAGVRFDHCLDSTVALEGHGLLSVRLRNAIPPPPSDARLRDAVVHSVGQAFGARIRPLQFRIEHNELAMPVFSPGYRGRMAQAIAACEAKGISLRGRHISGHRVEDRVRIDARMRALLPDGVLRV